jgi:hypothetical protein
MLRIDKIGPMQENPIRILSYIQIHIIALTAHAQDTTAKPSLYAHAIFTL